MYISWRLPVLTGFGVIPVILLALAGVNPWLAMAGWLMLTVTLTVIDVALAPRPAVIIPSRDTPTRALFGQPVPTRLRLENTGNHAVAGSVRDGWQPTAGAPTVRARFRIGAEETWSVEITLHPRRRGEIRSDFVALRVSGPLRLAGRQRVIPAPGVLRVLPAFNSRKHLPSRIARLRELDGNTRVNIRGQGTEFDSLREYVRGDDVRSIDWRATARSQNTMLRTWRPERDRHVVIVIDTGRTAATRIGDGVRLDASIESALLLAALAASAGDHVHVVMFDRALRARVTRAEGPVLLPTLVDAIAPVQAQLIETDWGAVRAVIDTLTSRPSLVVLLTAQDSPDSARAFLAALPVLTARSRVLVAQVSDAPVSVPERVDALDVYREAAAERAGAELALVSSAVTRAGAVPIVGSPEDLPPRVADRYLELKAAGLL